MNHSTPNSNDSPPTQAHADSVKNQPDDSAVSGASSSAKRISRRRVVSALSLSLLGGMLLIWFMQKPPADATESHSVRIEPASVADSPSTAATALDSMAESDQTIEKTDFGSTDLGATDSALEDSTEPQTIEDLISTELIAAAEHPLDPVLSVAEWSMEEIDNHISDYRCVITSQVFIHDRLDKERRMKAKIRHAQTEDDVDIPFSVYLNFLAPRSVAGQEVIWVDGQNDGKMIAHAASGFLRLKRMHLAPDGPIAMRGSKYPIWDIGFRNLIGKMYEIGCCDRDYEDCQVTVTPGVKVEGRTCTLIEISHEHEKECFQFHHAKIYVDNERKLPIGYEGYDWPTSKEEPLPLLEKFYYTDVDLNVGLTDRDFDPDNPRYKYPGW